MARRDASRFRRRGPDRMARSLARRASAQGLQGATVLEIGGGVGQVLLELVRRGAAGGEVVELVPAYEEHVHALAAELDAAERVSFRTADLVADPAGAEPADIVVMNKVVCCTPDGIELARIAAGLARRTLVLSHPRDVWWTRTAFGAVNAYLRVRRRRFRVHVHAPGALEEAVRSRGLARASERDGPLFRIAAFERV
jgi:magnesium-protoporphyrin O-methyltransferase